MTLQLLHSIFSYMYMRKIWFSFLSVHLIICPHPDFLHAEYLPYLLLNIYLLSASSCLKSLYCLLLPVWYLPIICYFLPDISLLSATSCLISLYYLLLPAWYLSIICYFLPDISLLSATSFLISTYYLPDFCLLYAFITLYARSLAISCPHTCLFPTANIFSKLPVVFDLPICDTWLCLEERRGTETATGGRQGSPMWAGPALSTSA